MTPLTSNVYLAQGVVFPEYVGYLELNPGFRVAFGKKPNWFHRKMISLDFGWNWVDGKL